MALKHTLRLAAALVVAATSTAAAQSAVSYLNPPELPRAPRYSHAAKVNGGRLVFVSGEVALDANGQLVGRGDFRKQAEQVFANLRAALAAAGAGVSDVVSINSHLVNLADIAAYRDVRQAFFSTRTAPPPTSTTIQVAGLVTEGALLEVSVVAVVPESRPAAAAGADAADPITVVAVLHARSGRADELHEALRSNGEQARAEAGCLRYDLHRGVDDPSLFVLYETWTSRKALDDHFAMPYMTAWAPRRDVLVERREVNVLKRSANP
jgi:enamine deaminase RidA (YjgF/YER057c/UK114 family)/quinol monooxygenase YgiN